MAEGTYEYECMRAELLGVDKPDYEEFMQRKREGDENRRLAAEVEGEVVEAANLKVAEEQADTLKSTGGKLDELNSILSTTQKRLDRFKVRCGSVTEFVRTKIGSINISGNGSATAEDAQNPSPETSTEDADMQAARQEAAVAGVQERQSELQRAMDNHVDKLDSLLNKAERAEIALSGQNKQIRSYLK